MTHFGHISWWMCAWIKYILRYFWKGKFIQQACLVFVSFVKRVWWTFLLWFACIIFLNVSVSHTLSQTKEYDPPEWRNLCSLWTKSDTWWVLRHLGHHPKPHCHTLPGEKYSQQNLAMINLILNIWMRKFSDKLIKRILNFWSKSNYWAILKSRGLESQPQSWKVPNDLQGNTV